MPTRKTILKDQQELEALQALANMFTKADRVLTGDKVNVGVSFGSSYPAPAWSDGINVTFNGDQLDSLTDAETLVRIFGLNYHELAHVMFTPRLKNTTFGNAIMQEGMRMAFNVLEDQRIETLLTGLYPSTIPYLVSTFMRYCADNESSWEVNYTLAHGRRYIPVDVRKQFRKRFKHQHLIPQLDAIIDEYRLLVFPTGEDRALELIREFHYLMTASNIIVSDPNGHNDGRPDVTKGSPDGVRKQQQAADAAADLDEALDEEEADDDGEGDGDTDGSGGAPTDPDDDFDGDFEDEAWGDDDGEGTDGETTSEGGDEQGDGDGDSEDGTGQGDLTDDADGTYGGGDDEAAIVDSPPPPSDIPSDDDGESGDIAGNGGQGGNGSADDEHTLTDDEMRDLLNDVANQAQNDPGLRSDVESAQKTISAQTGLNTDLPRKQGLKDVPVHQADVPAVRKFAAVLEQLRADVDPGWKHYQPSGRLNVRRAIDGASYDEMWDRWQPGHNDATDIECVIAIDTSISMSYRIDAASRALWVIKRALERVKAKVTVLSFSDSGYLVYKKDEQTSSATYRLLPVGGGTVPNLAVQEAVRVLDSSKHTTRIFIAITDGDWYDDPGYAQSISDRPLTDMTSDQMIAALNHHNVTTALAFIGTTDVAHVTRHNCQVVGSVHDPLALVDFAKQVVAQAVKDTIAHQKF